MAISTLLLITVLGLVFSATSAVQNSSSALDKANSLFSVLEEASATVVKVFGQLDAKGIAAPQDSVVRYNEALLLADEAESMMQSDDYSAASAKVVEALQKLKESLRIVYGSVTAQPSEFEVNVEKAIVLNSSITRYFEQLFRIENLTGIAEQSGFDTTLLENNTEAAKLVLKEALIDLEEGRLDAASGNVAEAKVLIDDLSSSLGELAVDVKVQRLSAYIAETEVRLESLRARAISVSSSASLTYVNQAQTSLSNAKDYLEQQIINQTLVELANSRYSELQAEAYLKPVLNSTSSVTASSLTAAVSP
jgi:hypothetical protein